MAFSAGDISATLTLDRSPFQQGLDAAKAEAAAFEGNRYAIKLDADGDPFRTAIDEARVKAEEFAGLRASVTLDADTARFDEAMRSSRALADEVGRARPAVTVTANTGQATAGMSEALAQAKRLEAEKALIKVGLDKILLENDILELRARVVEMDRLAFTIQAKADVIQAAADLAGLEAQAAALDRKEIQLRVKAEGLEEVKAATAQAAGEMSQLQMYAGLAAAALPLVGAAVVALPGLLAAAVVPAATVALGLDGIKAAAQSLQTPFIQLKGAVSDTFEAGLEPAIRNVAGLLPTLQAGLTGSATSLSGLATNVTAVVTSSTGLQSIFTGVNNLITGLSPGISGLTSNLIGLAQQGIAGLQPLGAVFTQLSAEWQAVIDTLQRTGQGQAAVDALVQVLGGVLQLLPPLVQVGAALMAAIGPPLAAALQATANVLTPIANLFSALPGPVQTAAAGVIAFRVAMSLLGSSGGEAAAATRSVGTAAEQAGRSIATGAESTNRFTSAARSVGGALSEMGAAYSSVALKAEQSTGGLREFGSIAGGVAKAGVTGLKTAAGGLLTVLGGPWGLAIGAATVGLGLLGDHMAANAQKAQSLAQESQNYANALSQTGGVITSVITKQAAQAAQQDGLFDSAQKLGVSTQDVTSAITGQGTAAVDLTAKLQGIVKANTTIGGYNPYTGGKIADSMNETGKAAQDLLDKLNAHAAAFKSGAVAQKALSDAMGDAASHFGAEAVAAEDGARTTALFAQAMQDAGENSLSASDKVKGFASAFQSASDVPRTFFESQLKANEALTKFGTALEKVPPAVVSVTGAIDSTTEAGQKLGDSVLKTADAYDKLYGATYLNARQQGSDVPAALAKAATASADYRQKIVDQMVAHGQNRQAVQAMVDTLFKVPAEVKTQIETPGMIEAVLAADGLKDKIVQLPGHKGIVVDTNSPAVIAQLEAMGVKVKTLPGGKIEIGADVTQADAVLKAWTDLANRTTGIPALDSNPDLANQVVAFWKGTADATTGMPTVDANSGKANDVLAAWKRLSDGTTGIPALDSNPALARAVLDAWKATSDTTTGVPKLDADPAQANAQLGGWKGSADATTGTAHLNADPKQANDARDGWATVTSRTTAQAHISAEDSQARGTARGLVDFINTLHAAITITANSFVSNPLATLGQPAGGGIVGYGGGGVVPPRHLGLGGYIPGYDPGVDTVPAILSRGEAVLVPELVRMLGPANILAANAAASGRQPSFLGGATPGGMGSERGAGFAAVNLGPRMPRTVRGSDGAASGDIVAAIRELRADVQALQKAKGDVTINAPTYNPSAEPSSESQARALRTGAALVSLLPR